MFIEHRSDGDFVSVMNARELLGKEDGRSERQWT
jgi:hypothetical protein